MKQGILFTGILFLSVMTGCNKDNLTVTGSGNIRIKETTINSLALKNHDLFHHYLKI